MKGCVFSCVSPLRDDVIIIVSLLSFAMVVLSSWLLNPKRKQAQLSAVLNSVPCNQQISFNCEEIFSTEGQFTPLVSLTGG